MAVTYEVRYMSVQTLTTGQRAAFIVVVSLLISFIGLQFFQTGAFLRRVWLEATKLDLHSQTSDPSFLFRVWWTLPTRLTIWNPIIFVLCICGMTLVDRPVLAPPGLTNTNGSTIITTFASIQSIGDLQNGQILLGVANLVVAYKLATYFEFTARFITYFQLICENMLMLCAAMTLTICSFAWLLAVTSSTTAPKVAPSFQESFVLVVRMLLSQVTPNEFETLGSDMWFSFSFIFYASQIVLNLILVRIAAPICYHALKKEESAAEFVMESMRKTTNSFRQLFAT